MIRKKITAILKLGLFLLPASTMVSGLAGGIIISCIGGEIRNDAVAKFEASNQFEQIYNEKVSKLKEQLEQGEISQEEYDTVKSYLESEDYVKSEMQSNIIENKEVAAMLKEADNKEKTSEYSMIPLGIGLLSSLLYISEGFRSFSHIRENMEDGYWDRLKHEEKKAEREKKRKEREFEKKAREYKEEVL